ncbi:pentatricopeptide repeat-containing protein 2, mitochondrial [Folsomia candida]|uniref:pentatricopeptide repeat-containing protein 2, mitochondrial n=1 Tax=Folsomia candida TaxID=158441 RepID=UPI000B8F2D32|nr:pentatricopeptide repeat-containing protein 2, mitochondrial [Folsomia candida]
MALSLSRTLSLKLLNSSVFLSPQKIPALLGGCRTLFAVQALGVDGYEKQRERTVQQFAGMTDKFREKMKEFSTTGSKNMIFTEDLKNMVHMIEDNPEDMALVLQMMKRFNQQNRHLRFGNFVFGPVVMRMYHFLNQPTQALQAFKDPELEGFFDQLATYQVLCDLLYNNAMYQEVIDVFEIVKSKQVQGTKYPRNVLVIVFASCYKLNTVQSYEYALSLLQQMKTVGALPVRRLVTYAAGLAVNQNAPNIALEILSLSGVSNYVTIRNLKLLSLSELGRPEDCLPILRTSIEVDNPTGEKRSTVCSDVLEKVAQAVAKANNKEVTVEFEKITKALKETGQISENLKSILDADISAPDADRRFPQGQQRQSMQRSFRIGQSLDLRPRRNPLYERERQSIRSD